MPGPYADDRKCQRFVANLKQLRALRGWSQEDLAGEAHVSVGTVAMTESFARPPRTSHGRGYDTAFKLTDFFERDAREVEEGAYSEPFRDFPEHEASADDLYVYDNALFPGLLHTEDYARASCATMPNITPDEIDRVIAGRQARQQILFGEGKEQPRIWVLVDEAALHRPVGAAHVMYKQCLHALDVARMSAVSLAVVPYAAGGHIGTSGACTIAERDGHRSMVNLEDLADGRVTDDPVIVQRVSLRFRWLQTQALPCATSQDFIARKAEELWKTAEPTGARARTAVPVEDSV